MNDSLNIAWYSMDIAWEQPQVNLRQIEQFLFSLKNKKDLVVLPEMCTTGFSMNVGQLAETMEGPSIRKLQLLSQEYSCALVGSLMITENGSYYNRLFFIQPNKAIEYYDKKHLFSFAGEDQIYRNGDKRLVVEYKGWRIACFVCYDLRFPAWIRNRKPYYDLALFVANWPKSRVFAWNQLLIARSIENQSYTLGVNRVGSDANNLEYQESSVIYGPGGETLSSTDRNSTVVKKSNLIDFRNKFRFLDDGDHFEL